MLLHAVSRPEGATPQELTAAMDWLPHTTRAALARLCRRGHDVRLASMGSRRRLLMLGVAWKWQAEIHGGLPKPLAARPASLEAAFRQTGGWDGPAGSRRGRAPG